MAEMTITEFARLGGRASQLARTKAQNQEWGRKGALIRWGKVRAAEKANKQKGEAKVGRR